MKKFLWWLWILLCTSNVHAHPMPSSIVELSVLESFIRGEAKIPHVEVGNAVGEWRVLNMNDPFFKTYFTTHIQAFNGSNRWITQIQSIAVITGNDPFVGVYQEVLVTFTLTPADIRSLRSFTFHYDAVIHQVITHSALVSVRQDWSNGIQGEHNAQQVGIVELDIPTEKIFPLRIDLEKGSWWKGFKSMFSLGMQHIKEGTDHLSFLIVLLLPAMLLTNGKQWGRFGGIRYSIINLLKIVTAFTIGHSITLLAGALGWLKLPGQPVEILIAFSILISAVHALRPVFPGKETLVAAGFGLIHGLAFATVLTDLDLSAGKLALSILGFNLGIEVMQLFVIAITVPWLILLSKTPAYKWVRSSGAVLAGIAAVAWIAERITGKANHVTSFIQNVSHGGLWLIAGLAITSLTIYMATTAESRNTKLT